MRPTFYPAPAGGKAAVRILSYVARQAMPVARLALPLLALPTLAAPLNAPPMAGRLMAPNTVASGAGVNIHGVREGDLDAIASSGVHIVRLDLSWPRIETSQGVYDWSSSDVLVAGIANHGMRPLVNLNSSNPVYSPPSGPMFGAAKVAARAPTDTPSRGAYARFAVLAAKRYARYNPIIELWNEPNADRFWLPHASPSDYLTLANQTCNAIRAALPNAEIIAPGLGNTPKTPAVNSPFFSALGRSPAMGCLSAVSVHPYLSRSDLDNAPGWWSAIHASLGLASGKPLFASETGVSTFGGRLTDLDQAFYLLRQAIYNAASGVQVTVWYDWRDDGNDPNNPEDHFGLTTLDGRPKPAYVALRTLTHAVTPFQGLCVLRNSQQVRAFFSGRGSARLMVVWNNGFGGRIADSQQGVAVALPPGANVQAVSDMFGQRATSRAASGQMIVTGTSPAYYITYTGSSPKECGST